MKRFLLHIISLVLAVYFLLAGSGFNVVDYCCNGCREAGIEYIAHNSCFAVHNHEGDTCCSAEHEDEDHTISKTHSHKDHCSVNRFNVETPTVSFSSQLFSAQILQPVFVLVNLSNLLAETSVTENFYLKFPPPFLTSSGRYILSLKSVLII